MYEFGKPKSADAAQQTASEPETSLSPEAKEALAIDDGRIKVADEAARAALPRNAAQVLTEPMRSSGGDSNEEDSGMEQSTENQNARPPNGNGAQSGAAEPFSHAAPEGAARKVSEVLGEIVWLLSQSPLHKRLFIQDLEWFVMTPILLKQFRTFYAKDRPIGVVLWAYATEEVAAMLADGTTKLRPQDWDGRPKPAAAQGVSPTPGMASQAGLGGASGAPTAEDATQVWIVEAIAPFGGAEEMVKDLKANVFPGREVRYLATGPQGKDVKVV